MKLLKPIRGGFRHMELPTIIRAQFRHWRWMTDEQARFNMRLAFKAWFAFAMMKWLNILLYGGRRGTLLYLTDGQLFYLMPLACRTWKDGDPEDAIQSVILAEFGKMVHSTQYPVLQCDGRVQQPEKSRD
jgi:hypothetical protein